MSIGADLAEARRQAGLTVTQVSKRTCIRETIIQSIERDDYAVCGGDFYARGHIRAIAKVVGADAGPLIGEFDAVYRAPAVPAASLFGPVTPVRSGRPSRQDKPGKPGRQDGPSRQDELGRPEGQDKPDRPDRPGRRQAVAWAVALGLVLVAVLGLTVGRLIPGSGHHPGATAGPLARVHRPVHHRPARPGAAPVPGPYAHKVAIRLKAIEACWVEFTTPGGGLLFQSVLVAGTSKGWAFPRPVDLTLGNPGGVRLTVDGKRPLPPGPAPPVTLHLGLNSKISR